MSKDKDKIAEPSYAMSIVGGLFLGILGMAIIMLFPENKWIMAAVPITGLLAGWLGAYVAAEPYVELKEQYDALVSSSSAAAVLPAEASDELKGLLAGLAERMDAEGTRLVKEAAGAGEDGVRLAAAAEYLRTELALIKKLS